MNFPFTADSIHRIFPTLYHVQWTRYVQVASLTLVIHDHLLTLPREIDLVWRGAHTRSWPRVLFFAARYACPIALIINTFALLDQSTSDELFVYDTSHVPYNPYVLLGRAWLFFHGWSGYAFFGGVQVISQMRLWAMYRSRNLLLVMSILSVFSLAAMGVIEGLGYTGLQVTADPVEHLVHMCGPGHLKPYVWAFWLPPICVETVSVLLVVYKAVVYFRHDTPKQWAGSRMILSIVQHSVAYFVVVLGVYLANMIIWLRFPINTYELIIPLTYALPSVAGNRMLLALRGLFYDKHSLLPGHEDTISLTVVNPDRGLTVYTHNPLTEFDSFFGELSHG